MGINKENAGCSAALSFLEQHKQEMAQVLANAISIKAIAPESGGEGEAKKAEYLQKLLESWGISTSRFEYKDKYGFARPNIVAKLGSCKRTIWLISHMDTVSEGDISLWKTDPFKGVIREGKVFGRGSNDDGQAVISSIYALRALKETRQKLAYNLGVVLTAGEETGSEYGIKRLVNENIFSKNDLFIVPDFGAPKGDQADVAEKGVLWVRISVMGKQVHASMPEEGVNAYRYAIRFLSRVDDYLHKKYKAHDSKFLNDSTFELTKHEKNIDSINIIPGKDVSYIDCRILPQYTTGQVLNDIKRIAASREFAPAKIKVEVVNREEAQKTSEKSEVFVLLANALKTLRNIKLKPIGLGGGTDAKPIRKKGMPAIAWSTQYDVAHQPNEFAVIDFMVEDAKVFAYIACEHNTG